MNNGRIDPHTASLEVLVFKAADGDCILIRCLGDTEIVNVLVDTGRPIAVERLKKYLRTLNECARKIDLFVVTHIDSDHIAGAIRIAKDPELIPLVKEVWFNGAKHLVEKGSIPLSIAEGDEFQELIVRNDWNWNGRFSKEAVMRREGARELGVANDSRTSINLLGPYKEALLELGKKWPPEDEEEPTTSNGALAMSDDQELDIEALALETYVPDRTLTNKTSIAFVLRHGPISLMISSDSHAEDLVRAIDEDYGEAIEVDAATLPHHGAAGNMSPELVRRVSAETWIVSTEGGNHRVKKPNQAAIARLLHFRRQKGIIQFAFNSAHAAARIWNDHSSMSAYNYGVSYPEATDDWALVRLPLRH